MFVFGVFLVRTFRFRTEHREIRSIHAYSVLVRENTDIFNAVLKAKVQKNIPKVFSESCWTSKTKRFAKIVNSSWSLTIFGKCSILEVWQGSEYLSGFWFHWQKKQSYHGRISLGFVMLKIFPPLLSNIRNHSPQ